MLKVICPNCGNKVCAYEDMELGEVICDNCDAYVGEIVTASFESDDGTLEPKKMFLAVLEARGVISRFDSEIEAPVN